MASIGSDVSMYSGAKTVVRTVYGNSESFEVNQPICIPFRYRHVSSASI